MISVALLHVDREVGQSLGRTLAATPDFALRGVATDLAGLHALRVPQPPDVLVVDLRARHAAQLLDEMRGCSAEMRPLVLALALSADDPRLADALCRGADGYFVQARSARALPDAIRQLHDGEAAMSPQVARDIREKLAASERRAPVFGRKEPGCGLAEADRLLLQWTAEGYLVSEVARGLRISSQAVGMRIHHIYRKVQADPRSRTALIAAR